MRHVAPGVVAVDAVFAQRVIRRLGRQRARWLLGHVRRRAKPRPALTRDERGCVGIEARAAAREHVWRRAGASTAVRLAALLLLPHGLEHLRLSHDVGLRLRKHLRVDHHLAVRSHHARLHRRSVARSALSVVAAVAARRRTTHAVDQAAIATSAPASFAVSSVAIPTVAAAITIAVETLARSIEALSLRRRLLRTTAVIAAVALHARHGRAK